MSYIGKATIGTNTYPIGSTLYGTCTTAASIAEKVVVMTDFDILITGVTIHVKFTYSNTATNPMLNVNGTGAKRIYRYGTTAPSTSVETSWNDGSVVSFTYDGTYWQMNDWNNNDTTYSSKSASSGGTELSLVTTGEKAIWNAKTSNTGTVTSVKVGSTSYSPSNGIVSLPAYPTTLPASDVSSWAKAASKPSYTASEIGASPLSLLDGVNYLSSLVGGVNLADFSKTKTIKNVTCTFNNDGSITLSGTGSWNQYIINLDTEVGRTYKFYMQVTATTCTSSQISVRDSSGSISHFTTDCNTVKVIEKEFIATTNVSQINAYPNNSSTSKNTFATLKIMIVPADLPTSGFIKYIPTNAELYEMIKSFHN